jgi:hypothetical protein
MLLINLCEQIVQPWRATVIPGNLARTHPNNETPSPVPDCVSAPNKTAGMERQCTQKQDLAFFPENFTVVSDLIIDSVGVSFGLMVRGRHAVPHDNQMLKSNDKTQLDRHINISRIGNMCH